MKFASAAASLADNAGSSLAFHHAILGNLNLLNGQQRSPPQVPSTVVDMRPGRVGRMNGRTLRAVAEAGREATLRKLIASEERTLLECIPQESLVEVADVGVLLCGPGQFCLELNNGGLCVPEDWFPEDWSPEDWSNMTAPPYSTSIIEEMYEVCYGNFSTVYTLYTCECSGVDVELYTGSVQCNSTSYCIDTQSFPCNLNITYCNAPSFSYDVTAAYTGTV
jgi:hypothetical protein